MTEKSPDLPVIDATTSGDSADLADSRLFLLGYPDGK